MMLKVCLSQRVDISATQERRDALDGAWTDLLGRLGMMPVPVPNRLDNPGAFADAVGCDALILSGGNDITPEGETYAAERNRTEAGLLEWARRTDCPVLGVCRGFQMMNLFCGGTVVPVQGHVGCDHPVRFPDGGEWQVNSYHNWGIAPAGLATGLQAVAVDPDGYVEAAVHTEYRWIGIMWHPERPIACADRHGALVAAAVQGKGLRR